VDKIIPGLFAECTTTVTETLTASHLGSGTMAVYATPAMIALMEMAARTAIDPLLEADQESVGTAVNIRHLAATPLGKPVRARAEVTAIDGRQVTFTVEAWDEREKIGEGTHTRFVVDLTRFRTRLATKA